MRTLCALSCCWLALAIPCAARGEDAPTSEQLEYFEKHVRPLFVERCYECHSAKKQQGSLRVDSRAALLKGGDSGAALTPGKPDESLMVEAVRYGADGFQMPPKGKLKDTEIAVIVRWVEMGAPWPKEAVVDAGSAKVFNLAERKAKHWSFQPLAKVAPPAVKGTDWAQSPIDRFILARLEAAGLSPAAPADKRTLIRRVTYDLIGLPPTPAEIATFLADDSPQAFERVVERLLASPHYGERWARHWLDLVRYAETAGHEFDFEIPDAWRYRDYVIRAFNADLPFNQFVVEQVAGDLLPDYRRHPTEGYNESIIGTAFYHLGEGKHSPVDIREEEMTRIDNQLDVLARGFLGLTLTCARCHDHKFDAISTKDYYALAGVLRSSRYQLAFLDAEAIAPKARELTAGVVAREGAAAGLARAALGEARANEYLLAAREVLRTKGDAPLAAAEKQGLDRGRLVAWAKRLETDPQLAVWKRLALAREGEAGQIRTAELGRIRQQAEARQAKLAKTELLDDFSQPDYRGWFVTGEAFGAGPVQSLALDLDLKAASETPFRVKSLIAPGVAHSGRLGPKLAGVLRSRTFTITQPQILYRAAGKGTQINLIIDGFQRIQNPIYGGLTIRLNHDDLKWLTQDVRMWIGQRAYVEVLDLGDGYAAIDEIRFADGGLPSAPTWSDELLVAVGERNGDPLSAMAEELQVRLRDPHFGSRDVELTAWGLATGELFPIRPTPEQVTELARLQADEARLAAAVPVSRTVPAMVDGTGENEHVHIRGSHKNLGEETPRRFLEGLAGLEPLAAGEGSGRLALAQVMINPAVTPLLPRVLVNRIWQQHFGAGLVRSPDDFGNMGQAPSHPELLDYLAGEFIQQGWSLKKLHRMLVLSSTYQMASRSEPAADTADPLNLLLHRMPIRRLEAEIIRDAVLTVSGRLDAKLFGPSVMPHLTSHQDGRGKPSRSGPLDGDGRRSIYINVRRNFLLPMFLAFDFPQPFSTMGRRSVSNVPAQALTLMNNPFVIEQAARWAKQATAAAPEPARRIEGMYETAFARLPTPEELAAAELFVQGQSSRYGSPNHPQAWADLAHVLFNVKEFIFVP